MSIEVVNSKDISQIRLGDKIIVEDNDASGEIKGSNIELPRRSGMATRLLRFITAIRSKRFIGSDPVVVRLIGTSISAYAGQFTQEFINAIKEGLGQDARIARHGASNGGTSFVAFAPSLTDSEMGSAYTAIQKLQAALGRAD